MPLGIPTGGLNAFTLAAGEVLTVNAGANATGRVVVFKSAATDSPVILAQDVRNGGQVTYGPAATDQAVRVYGIIGGLTVATAAALSALAPYEGAEISADGKTVSGHGAKPGSRVTVYDQDTGLQIGVATASAAGEWALVLARPLSSAMRVGYDITIVGSLLTAPNQPGAVDFSDPDNAGLAAGL